ncbi:hypothetical protein [Streptomyces sp. CC224B]|uniref:hypothetical protein n=1 Tax=Streptomyces sp. CC224B TaxID=3044571 RepID=UPI0024A8B8CA|nr:hypothetical protein [Streptomyces sp. CC224B]
MGYEYSVSGTLSLDPPMHVDPATPFTVAPAGMTREALEGRVNEYEFVLVAMAASGKAGTSGGRPTQVDQLIVDTGGQSTEFVSVLDILVRWAQGRRIEGALEYVGEDGARGTLSLQDGQWVFSAPRFCP